MDLRSLNEIIRRHMVDELDRDLEGSQLYLSPRLTQAGKREWPTLLRRAFEYGSQASLASALAGGMLEVAETRWRNGREITYRVPATAPVMLAEGEFNRFYVRGVCIQAMAEGREVEVYRAKIVPSPRPESEARIGTRIDPAPLLRSLRSGKFEGLDSIPGGPNSGISVFLV